MMSQVVGKQARFIQVVFPERFRNTTSLQEPLVEVQKVSWPNGTKRRKKLNRGSCWKAVFWERKTEVGGRFKTCDNGEDGLDCFARRIKRNNLDAKTLE